MYLFRGHKKRRVTMINLNRFELRKLRKEAKKTTTQKVVARIRNVFSTLRKWWYKEENHLYITKFDKLKCAEDLPKAYGNIYNKHNKINIYALWQFFTKCNAFNLKEFTNNEDIVCVVNTKRLLHFVRHMTKWKTVLVNDADKKIRLAQRRKEEIPIYNIGLFLNPDDKLINNMKEHTNNMYFLCGDYVYEKFRMEGDRSIEDTNLNRPNNILMNLK